MTDPTFNEAIRLEIRKYKLNPIWYVQQTMLWPELAGSRK